MKKLILVGIALFTMIASVSAYQILEPNTVYNGCDLVTNACYNMCLAK